MRFRWTYYYEDLEQERKQQQGHLPASGVAAGDHKYDEPAAAAAALPPLSASSESTAGSIQRPLQPHIPYLVWPSYSGDVLAIDYHAAQHAASASNQAQLDSIARDEAEYAAFQLRIAAERTKQQARSLSAQRAKKRRTSSSPASVADHFESFSFAPEDLLPPSIASTLQTPDPQANPEPPLPQYQQETDIRNRAAAIVKLGAGGPPTPPMTRWKPPPESNYPRSFGFWPSSSYPIKYDSNIGSITMMQRMAALGVLYSTGAAAMSSTSGGRRSGLIARAPTSAQSGVNGDIWSLSPHTFSAWFPPPYRVLTLVALGILVFAADVLVLARLGIDPVPLLFPAAAAGGSAINRLPLSSGASSSSLPGLGQGLVTSRQLGRALIMLGAIYTLIALGGWASFRFYVDSIAGDPSGRHAQALQGLAVTLALGLACWPGRFLFRPIRIAFWVALGRLSWPEPVPAFLRRQHQQEVRRGGRRGTRTQNGNGNAHALEEGEEAEGELEAEMNLFNGSGSHHHQEGHGADDEQEEDRIDTDTNPMLFSSSSTRQYPLLSRPNLERNAHRLTRAMQDTRRWFQPPSFSSVILADILTSFAKVFADVWLTACFLVPRKEHHTWWNGRGSVVVPILTSLPYVIRFRQCVSEYLSTGPLSASAASSSGRLFSKPADSETPAHQPRRRSRKPLWNALKYFSALPVIWLAALEGFASSELVAWQAGLEAEGRVEVLGTGTGSGLADGTRMVRRDLFAWGEEAKWRQKMIWRCWLFWVFFNSIFSFWWDVTNDWGLDMFRLRTVSQIIQAAPGRNTGTHLHPHHHHGSHRRGISSVVLRPPSKPLLFPEWAYHLSIVLDLILRFTWSIKLSSQLYRYADWEGGVFVFEALEILRRGAWVVLRFEHAALVGFTSNGGREAGGVVSSSSSSSSSSLDRSADASGLAETAAAYQDEEQETGTGLGSRKESRWGGGAAGPTSSRTTLQD
ncbi:protein-ER retention protein [Tilletia horrida]|nr:protein-ER retention protein [Tilletia horrida]